LLSRLDHYISRFDVFLIKPPQNCYTGWVIVLTQCQVDFFIVVNVVGLLMNTVFPRQLQGFVAAGGIATLFHWLVMAALIAIGLDPILATASGSVSGAVLNYTLQRRLAFRNAGPHRATLWRYIGSCLGAWFCNIVLFFLLNHVLALPVTLSQIVTTGLVAALNYIVYQRLIFHEQTL